MALTPTNAAAKDLTLNLTETFPKDGAVTITPATADCTYVVMAIGNPL